jgi:DNA-directed RNA polymerase specialized sigma24 family protein
MNGSDVEDLVAAQRDGHHRRAVRFFWTVLIMASAASIAGNAVHATLNATAVPPAVAAAVATAPPLVLLGSTEGVSLLLRARQHGSSLYWCALAMTVLLAACAFVLSFDALRDLAVRAGIREQLAWLWPIAVDVTIAQATLSLLSLSRGVPAASVGVRARTLDDTAQASLDELVRDFDANSVVGGAHGRITAAAVGSSGTRTRAAVALVQDKITKKSPELVAEVLHRYAAGEKVGTIASAMDVHHSTVRRLLAADQQRARASVSV